MHGMANKVIGATGKNWRHSAVLVRVFHVRLALNLVPKRHTKGVLRRDNWRLVSFSLVCVCE